MTFLSLPGSLRRAAVLLIPVVTLPASGAPLSLSPLPGSSSQADCVFKKLDSSQTGLKHQAMIEANHPLRRLYASAMSLGGLAGGDVNGDGRPDLFFCGAAGSSRLYVQTGPLQFKDVTAEAGLETKGKWDVGTAIVDINGDGKPDIFVARYDQPCALYINQGAGPNGIPKFKDEAAARGVAVVDASHTPVFFDYDRDGSLDLYLMTNRYYRETEATASEMVDSTPEGKVSIRPEMAKYYGVYRAEPDPAGGRMLFEAGPVGRPDYLFHNDGSGKFTDVTEKAGISGGSRGLSTTVWDYDNDGWPDLYVANDFEDYDCLYHNNHDGTFTDAIRTTVPLTSWFSMGADCADFDGDGLLDLFVADMSGTTHFKQKISMGSMSAKASFLGSSNPRQAMRNTLFLNTRSGRFREAAFLSHLDSSDWTWAVQAQDFDSDGRPDIYVTNGMTRNFNEPDDPRAINPKPGQTLWDRHKDLPKLEEQNLAWRNDGDLHFTDVSKKWGLAEVSVSMAAASLDLDGDGRLDIVTVDADRSPGVYQNSGGGNRLTVALHQPGPNASAIGARVTLTAGDLTLVREIQLMHGYLGCQPAELHFGLGTAAQADSLRVRWPDGREESFGPVPANQRCLVERSDKAQPPSPPPVVTPLFKASAGFPPMRMEEIPFDDFWVQPLLPNKNSQLGPGLAFTGVDADGYDRFYLCGPHQHKDQWWSGLKTAWKYKPGADNAIPEKLGAVSFDANADGVPDLYVACGSSEFPPGDPGLAHALYLGDAGGAFVKAPAELCPEFRDAAGALAAADFDGDGRVDLFVGGRLVPGAWPRSPVSHLLHNTPQGLVDIAAEIPGLQKPGMVTSALWADIDSDGLPELILALEWGPVKVFANRGGKLTDATAQWGLADRTGWWNSIAAADIDGDGDLDLFVGNFGLNTKYHTSREHPVTLFYGDMDGSGHDQLVEAKYEGDNLLPVRGRSCSSAAMPVLKDRFKTFRSFAGSSLEQIYTPDRLKAASKFTVSELASGILRNDGGKFTFVPLPRQAQLAPVFGCAFLDADADGNMDLLLAENFWSPQLETGRMDGDLGQLLLGNGDGTFRVLPPDQSGILVPGDAKALVLADWNRDGAPDAIFTRNNDRAIAVEGAFAPQGNHRLTLHLAGPKNNPFAVGAAVSVKMPDKTRRAVLCGGGGYLSQSAPYLFMGLGKADRATEVIVTWPGGRQSVLKDVPPGIVEITFPK